MAERKWGEWVLSKQQQWRLIVVEREWHTPHFPGSTTRGPLNPQLKWGVSPCQSNGAAKPEICSFVGMRTHKENEAQKRKNMHRSISTTSVTEFCSLIYPSPGLLNKGEKCQEDTLLVSKRKFKGKACSNILTWMILVEEPHTPRHRHRQRTLHYTVHHVSLLLRHCHVRMLSHLIHKANSLLYACVVERFDLQRRGNIPV